MNKIWTRRRPDRAIPIPPADPLQRTHVGADYPTADPYIPSTYSLMTTTHLNLLSYIIDIFCLFPSLSPTDALCVLYHARASQSGRLRNVLVLTTHAPTTCSSLRIELTV